MRRLSFIPNLHLHKLREVGFESLIHHFNYHNKSNRSLQFQSKHEDNMKYFSSEKFFINYFKK